MVMVTVDICRIMVLMVVLLSDVDIQFFVCNFLNKHVPVSKSSFAFAKTKKDLFCEFFLD